MKKTRIVSIILIFAILLTFVACSKTESNKPNTPANQTTTNKDPNTNKEPDINKDPVETQEETIPSQEETQPKKMSFEELMENYVKCSVLSSTVVDYKDALINGYLQYSEDYEKATIVTIGIEFTDFNANYNFGNIKLTGETASDGEGNPVPQTSAFSAWKNDDSSYAIFILRVAGEIDLSKVDVLLTQDAFLGKNQYLTKLENNGQIVGFERAIEKFSSEYTKELFGTDSNIVKLKNRYYFLERNSWSGIEEGKYTFVITMIPVEGGFTRTLTADDVNLSYDTSMGPNIELQVNQEQLGGVIENHTLMKIFVEDHEQYNEARKTAVIEIDDGDGNFVKIHY